VKEPVKGIKALCEKLEACRNQVFFFRFIVKNKIS